MHLKYELLPAQEITTRHGEQVTVHRLRALRDIPAAIIVAGDLGGYVSGPETLSHEGECWIDGFAVVLNSFVTGNAQVKHTAFVRGSVVADNAMVFESANVDHDSIIMDSARAGGNSSIQGTGDARTVVKDEALVSGNARITSSTISGNARIWGNALLTKTDVSDNAIIEGKAIIHGGVVHDRAYVTEDANVTDSTLKDRATIYGSTSVVNSTLSGRTEVADSAVIIGSTVTGDSHIYGSARVEDTSVDSLEDEGTEPYFSSSMDVITPGAVFTPPSVDEDEEKGTTMAVASVNPLVKTLEKLEGEYNGYLFDISTLLTMPAIADMTNADSRLLAKSLRKARVLVESGDILGLPDAVDKAEDALLIAVSNAKKAGVSELDEQTREIIRTAKGLIAVSLDPYKQEQGRRDAFIECFRILEGVIVVPAEAALVLEGEIGVGPIAR